MAGIARALAGLVAAQALFAATFRGPRRAFWHRMTVTGVTLGGYALAVSPCSRHAKVGPKEVTVGLGSAAALYATFWIGDRVARRIMPSGDDDIADIYALRELRPKNEIALRLLSIIAPAEEIFWRGLVQSAFMRRYGRWRGAALATAAYGGVHLVTGNLTLTGAAIVAGAHWGALYALGVPLGALVVSHAAWDIWIFLLQPTNALTQVAAPPA